MVKNPPDDTRNVGWVHIFACLFGGEDSLEYEMTTYFSIPAWKIPWTEEPGGLQSMESQRVRRGGAQQEPPPRY